MAPGPHTTNEVVPALPSLTRHFSLAWDDPHDVLLDLKAIVLPTTVNKILDFSSSRVIIVSSERKRIVYENNVTFNWMIKNRHQL